MKNLLVFAASGLLGVLLVARMLEPDREGRDRAVVPSALPAPPPPPPLPPELRDYATAEESIALSEVHYHPASDDPRDEWIELFNRSTQPRDIGGWSLAEAVDFTFADGTVIPPGGYLVAAADLDRLRSALGSANVVGNWTGTLKDGDETIRLVARDGREVLAFHYQDRLPFPVLADGGGRSLELRNPHGDLTSPGNWGAAASSGWQRFAAEGIATSSRLYLYLLGAGTAYVDDVSLQPVPGGRLPGVGLEGAASFEGGASRRPHAAQPAREALRNGGFEEGDHRWRFEGNHQRSQVTARAAHGGRHSLQVVATGPGSTRTTAVVADVDVVSGERYRLEFWAVLPGSVPIVARFSGSRDETGGIFIETRPAGMTPGQANSLFTSRTPPFIHPVSCSPARPAPGEPVTVTAAVAVSSPLKEATLILDAGSGLESIPLRDEGPGAGPPGDGVLGASIGPFADGALVRYYVTCRDEAGARGRFPPDEHPTAALGLYVGHPDSERFPVYRLFLSPEGLADLDRNPSSDVYRQGDLVVDGRVHLDIGVRYRGQTSRYYPKHHWKVKFEKHAPLILPDSAGLHTARTINLNSSYADKSFLRETLGYLLFRDLEEPYSQCRYVLIHLNGAFSGLFLQLENPGEDYLKRNGIDSGWLWKSYDNALGTAASRFELKAGDAETGGPVLDEFMENINSLQGIELAKYLTARVDVESMIDYLVGCQLIHNTDHVEKNYLLHASPEGRFRVLPWDLDLTHGRNFECSGGGDSLLNDDLRHDMWDPEYRDEALLFGTRQHPKCEGRGNGIIDAFLGRTKGFRPAYYARLAECLARYYHPDVLIPKVRRLAASIREEARRDRQIWGTYRGESSVDHHVGELEDWVRRRFAHLEQKLKALGYTVGEPLNADFETSLPAGPAPLTVKFEDFSLGRIERRQWEFGDGTTSTEARPTHVFQEPGCYTVTLVVAGPAGEHRAVRRDLIHVRGEGNRRPEVGGQKF